MEARMHIREEDGNGWEQTFLADEREGLDALAGCFVVRYMRRTDRYVAMVQLTERDHDSYFVVRASVFERNGDPFSENTEKDIRYFRRRQFMGPEARAQSAFYGIEKKGEIGSRYFGDSIETTL